MMGEEKRRIRATIRACVRQVSAEERSIHSAAAREQLAARPEWRQARVILGYVPLLDELDLTGSLEAALQAGKTVAVPRFVPGEGVYCAALVTGTLAGLGRGAFGVMEPPASAPTVPLNRLDFALVPGVAFDPGGRRLGRGKGFYDRLLAMVPGVQCLKCGVALEEQVVDALPAEPHDVSMNFILTPGRWMAIPAKSPS